MVPDSRDSIWDRPIRHARLGALVLLGGLLAAVPIRAEQVVDWQAGRVEADLRVQVDSARVRLPSGWIQLSSFRLTRADTLLIKGLDYLLDPKAGSLRLLRRFPDGTRLHVSYRAFPIPLKAEIRRHPLVWEGGAARSTGSSEGPEGPPGVGEPETQARLAISGSKTFAVEVGTRQDLALRQSLDLSVTGRVGRDVSVRAVLTDRQTPLQGEGTSASLQELDRVLVEVESPNASMTLGDFRLATSPTEFSRYARQLQGARGEVTPGGFSVQAVGATTPGILTRFEFLGQEGKQGPYRLGVGGGGPDRSWSPEASGSIWTGGSSPVGRVRTTSRTTPWARSPSRAAGPSRPIPKSPSTASSREIVIGAPSTGPAPPWAVPP